MSIDELILKLQSQHFGPKDSIIASALMHPMEGLSKSAEYIQNQIRQASMVPTQPMSDPIQAQKSIEAGINLTDMIQTSALPFAPSGAGAVGTILAKGMPDFNSTSYDVAKKALKHGEDLEKVWRKHKLYPWRDAQNRQVLLGEISDANATLNTEPLLKLSSLPDVLSHEQLYKNQPELKDVSVFGYKNPHDATAGSYDPNIDLIRLNLSHPIHKDESKLLSTLLHEITHKQQLLNNLPYSMDIPEGLSKRKAFKKYFDSPSERQARMTEDRLEFPIEDSPISTLFDMGIKYDSLWKGHGRVKKDVQQLATDVVLNKPTPDATEISNLLDYLYHSTSPKNIKSIYKQGLKPSKKGYEGPGVYFSKVEGGGEGMNSIADALVNLRHPVKPLVNMYGEYPNGSLQGGVRKLDDQDVILDIKGSVPPDELEIRNKYGDWISLMEYLNSNK